MELLGELTRRVSGTARCRRGTNQPLVDLVVFCSQRRRDGERCRSMSGFLCGCDGWERHGDTGGKGDGPRPGETGCTLMVSKLRAVDDGMMKSS